MIVIHCADVGSMALFGDKVAVRVKTPARARTINAAVFRHRLSNLFYVVPFGIIRNDKFKGLNTLKTQTSQSALQRVRSIAGDQRYTELNGGGRHNGGT